MRTDIVPGAIFPDYELSDHTAKRRKLSERALRRDEMLADITLFWLTGGSRRRTSAWPERPSSVERPVRSPDRPVGTRHEEKTMTPCELDIASLRDRAWLDYPWKETRKDL
jgi:hypothetical protein